MNKFLLTLIVAVSLLSCHGGKTSGGTDSGDTVRLKYAHNLSIVAHKGYTVVELADPWNPGRTLHSYVLVGKGGVGDAADHEALATAAAKERGATLVHVPVGNIVVGTSVHCGLAYTLGRADAVGGVCDMQYVHIPFVRQRFDEGKITDCGSGLQPTLEKIIDLQPDAIWLSPFQNSGGYGRVDALGIPIIEMADYMETSALGRAEWMKFYGMLLGAEAEADSLFRQVEADYLRLKQLVTQKNSTAEANFQNEETPNSKLLTPNSTPSILMDKQTGSVWYVPGGNSTLGHIIADANAAYAWADTEQSGSIALPFESVLEKAGEATYWLFRYNGQHPITYAELLSENAGYDQFSAFRNRQTYGCNTANSTFYEETPFSPNLLLRDFICIAHPELGLGEPRFFQKVKE